MCIYIYIYICMRCRQCGQEKSVRVVSLVILWGAMFSNFSRDFHDLDDPGKLREKCLGSFLDAPIIVFVYMCIHVYTHIYIYIYSISIYIYIYIYVYIYIYIYVLQLSRDAVVFSLRPKSVGNHAEICCLVIIIIVYGLNLCRDN